MNGTYVLAKILRIHDEEVKGLEEHLADKTLVVGLAVLLLQSSEQGLVDRREVLNVAKDLRHLLV